MVTFLVSDMGLGCVFWWGLEDSDVQPVRTAFLGVLANGFWVQTVCGWVWPGCPSSCSLTQPFNSLALDPANLCAKPL